MITFVNDVVKLNPLAFRAQSPHNKTLSLWSTLMFIAMLKKVMLRTLVGVSVGFVALSAGAEETMHRPIDVVLFNYHDQQIFDVTVGDVRVGSAGRFPYSGRRTKVGARFNDGAQKVTWRLPATNESEAKNVTARNTPALVGRSRESRFVAVHVYPDDTVEVKFSEDFPVYSARGQAISKDFERRKVQ